MVKGAGLKIRSRMGSWVRIPLPAPFFPHYARFHHPPRRGGFAAQTMQNRLTLGRAGRYGEHLMTSLSCSSGRFLAVLLATLMLGGLAPLSSNPIAETSASDELGEPAQSMNSASSCSTCQSYDLYLDEMDSENGGDGSITTLEPSGAHQEESALGGVEFRSAEMISDLLVYGRDNTDKVTLTLFLQFEGTSGSTADVTYSLKSGDSEIDSVSETLDDPCTGGTLGTASCSWTSTIVDFDVPSDGFTVANGKQLRLSVDAQATCEGSGGGGFGGGCEVNVAFGDVEQTNGYSKLEMKANALANSVVKVHRPGGGFLDPEVTEWSPNHRPDFRTMQFSVDVRDAFGRDDIQGVDLVMTTPNGAGTVFEKTFDDDDLKLDNNGLVGNYTYSYDVGMAAGEYPVQLEISDVQGHTLVFEHSGIEFIEHDVYLSLPQNQPDIVLIAPGQTSSVEFMIEHTGASASQIEVVFELARSLPSTWSDPVWDQPGGYTLSGGGTFARPILSIDVPDDDLTSAPNTIEIEARAYAENTEGQTVEVAVETIVLDIEESDVLSPPRIAVFEDDEHQKQIADSTRPEAYDETLSHYVDSGDISGDFFIDVFNSGFITDAFRLRVTDLPDAWQYKFFDNDTGMELTEEGIHSLTPDIGSHQILTVRMEVFPPSEREAQDIGLVALTIASQGDSELSTQVAFTVHRTFGVLVEVIADSDSGTLGNVGPVTPGSSLWYNLRITDSSDTLGQTTWRIINPADLDRNTEDNSDYASWDYTLSNGSESDIVVVYLESDQYADLKLDLELGSTVEAGNHTVYVRVVEEGVDAQDARYFDLPVTVQVKEDVQPGRLVITDSSSSLVRFSSSEFQTVEFIIDNQNNVPLDVVITLEEPQGWTALIRASSDQVGGNFLLLTLPAYSSKDFSLAITPPDNLKNGETVEFELKVTPMDEEVPYDSEYTQTSKHVFSTACDGAACFVNELVNPEPQTLALGAGLCAAFVFAVYRRGQRSANIFDDEDFEFEEEMKIDPLEDDIPAPVMEEDVDDDLELLDELDSL